MDDRAKRIEELDQYLYDLVIEFEKASPLSRHLIVNLYHKTIEELYSLGWDDVLQITQELEREFMPETYLIRNPDFGHDYLTEWYKKNAFKN